MKLKEIAFRDIKQYNDANSLIFMALTLEQEGTQEVTEFFEKEKLVPAGSVIEYRNITGNKRGKKGRTDVFIRLKDETLVNPIVRLKMSEMGVKWTSDFISNFGKDYNK